MTVTVPPAVGAVPDRYKWVALSNTTMGMLLATVNQSIVIISLPAIFRGIGLDPLAPGNIGYLLWMIMGFMIVSAMVVVAAGRLGDLYGRVKLYGLGFGVFGLASVALALTPWGGDAGAFWLIAWRVVQGLGGALLFANSAAIVTDAFPAEQRGTGLGINQVAAIAGSFLGLLVGGLLAEWHWRAVFWVSVPIAVVGWVWSRRSLREVAGRRAGSIDVPGNITLAVGLLAILVAMTYGIQPHDGAATGWGNPWVIGGVLAGVLVLVLFCIVESRVADPMLPLGLFRIRAFAAGNVAGLLAGLGRGGLQIVLIVWLQGIWLPLRGYDFESTPLWSAIYMLPLTVGFLVAGPVAGWLSDRWGPRPFAVGGLLLVSATLLGLMVLPVDFSYGTFALLLLLNGLGSGLFAAPNASIIMGSVPAERRGAASGVRATFLNASAALSIGVFFSFLVVGLAGSLPAALGGGLTAQGVPGPVADQIAALPPVGSLFAAFLGFNPVATLLAPCGVLDTLPDTSVATLTSTEFFPSLISGPFHAGLVSVFGAALLMTAVAAAIAAVGGGRRR